MDIKKVLLLWSMKFLDKNSTGSGVTTKEQFIGLKNF